MNEANTILSIDALLDAAIERTINRLNHSVKSPTSGSEDRSYSITNLAELNGVHPGTIRKLLRTGKLRCIRGIRHVRVPAREWHRFLDQNLGEWESTWSKETVEKVINKRKES
jgi:excisionase family DNA binding protein